MNRIPFAAAALAAALAAAAPMPMPASATDALLRCRSPDGTIGYTDRSCAVFGAQAVPVSGDMLVRIARDEARVAGADRLDDRLDDIEGLGPYAAGAPGRRSPAAGCARTPTQLAMDLHAALALGDVNRVAESYHFAGMSSAAGESTLDRLQRLVGRIVVDSHYYDASIAAAGSGGFADGAALLAGPGDAGPGMLQLVLGNGDGSATAIDFDVRRYAGCYFVSF